MKPLERHRRHPGCSHRSPAVGLEQRHRRRATLFLRVKHQQLLQPAGQQCILADRRLYLLPKRQLRILGPGDLPDRITPEQFDHFVQPRHNVECL